MSFYLNSQAFRSASLAYDLLFSRAKKEGKKALLRWHWAARLS